MLSLMIHLAEIYLVHVFSIAGFVKEVEKLLRKVQVGKDQEKAQSEKDSLSKNRGRK